MSIARARALCNPYKIERPFFLQGCEDPGAFHILEQHGRYQPTPLIQMKNLQKKTGIANLLVKDESSRMGCNSFKPLGTLNCLYNILDENNSEPTLDELKRSLAGCPRQTFIAAGDHTLSLATAWAAAYFAQKAEVYLPQDTCPGQVEAMKNLGAEVHLVAGNFASSFEIASEAASSRKSKHLVQEHSWNGCDKPARLLVDGYYSLFQETGLQLQQQNLPLPDVVILQSGSGLLLEAAARYFYFQDSGKIPQLVCVEPANCACILESASSPFGKATHLEKTVESRMTGLNYAAPSLISWPVIRSTFDLFLAIDDIWTFQAMKLFHNPGADDPLIQAGEAGAAGLGALLALMVDPDLENCKSCVHIDRESTVMVINTEGVIDRQLLQNILNNQLTLE